jgi:hypothetical protein
VHIRASASHPCICDSHPCICDHSRKMKNIAIWPAK